MLASRTSTTLVLVLALVGQTCRCDESPASPDAGDGSTLDASSDAGVDGDAAFDARPDVVVPPDGTLHDFCNEPYFKLPIDGQSERTGGIAISGHRVVWSKKPYPSADLLGEVYLLDLHTCIEHQLSTGTQAGWVDIHGDQVVWDDRKDGRDPWCTELRAYDLVSGIEERLTETMACELEPKTNGRFVAYRCMATTSDPSSLRLLDRQTGDDVELAPDWANIESFDINERYVVWAAYTQDAQSTGRDVYYRDLLTGLTHHLDSTYPRYQYWVFLWDDWITVRGSDAPLAVPTFLEAHNLQTLEVRSLVEGDYATSSGEIGSGLIAWNTSLYTGTQNVNPSDIELYSIDSQMSRRLTIADSYLRVRSISLPYQLYIHRLFLSSSFQNDFYIANLEALGVVDATGHLLPGGPVITPP